MNLFGRILGSVCGFVIASIFFKDVARGRRKSMLGSECPESPGLTFFLAMFLDVSVFVALFAVSFFGHGMFFGRTLCILLGYGIFNFGVSMVMNADSSDEDGGGPGCGVILALVAIAIIVWGATQYVSWVEILDMIAEILDD